LRSSAIAWLASRTWWWATALAAISRTRQELSRVAWMIAAVALSSHAWIRPRGPDPWPVAGLTAFMASQHVVRGLAAKGADQGVVHHAGTAFEQIDARGDD
jgi:hypothetical protein